MQVIDAKYTPSELPKVNKTVIPGVATVLIYLGQRPALIEISSPVWLVLAQPLEQIQPIFFN